MDPTLRQLMRYRKPQNVRQLFLDNQRIPSIELLCYEPSSSSSNTTDAYSPLPHFTGLLSLSLTGVHCVSLKNFPVLPELRRLALADNRIVDGLDALIDKVPLLNYLDLSNNRISDFSTLVPLRYMNKLRHLCLLDCEITKLPNYRAKIFEMLPTLHSLDGHDCNGKEVDSEEDDEDEEEDEDFESESYEEGTGEDTDEEGEEEGQDSRITIETVLSRIQDGVYINSDGEEIEVDQEALRNLIAKQRAAGVLLDDEEDDEEDGDYATNSDSENEDRQLSVIDTLSDDEEQNDSNEKESDLESNQEIISTNQSSIQGEGVEEEELSLEEDDDDADEEEEEGPGLAYLLQSPSNSDNDDEEEDSGWSPTKRKHGSMNELFGDEIELNSTTKLESTDENTDNVCENGTLKTKKPRR